jgi:hypothetical protein
MPQTLCCIPLYAGGATRFGSETAFGLVEDNNMEISEIDKTYACSAKPSRRALSWGLPLLVMGSCTVLALQPRLRLAVPAVVGVTAVIVILLAVIIYAGEKDKAGWSPAVILIVAACLRLLFVFSPPDLSNDLYRYLWDGLQVLNGHNPYAASPLEIQPHTDVTRHLLEVMNHPSYTTIYPPAAQCIFAAGAWLSDSFRGLKILLAGMDLAACALLIRLLSSYGLPARRAILYAWHPLPVLEIGSSGHIDGAGIFFLLLTMVLLAAGSNVRSTKSDMNPPPGSHAKEYVLAFSAGLAFAWAALVKLFPLLFLPGLLVLAGKRRRAVFVAGFVLGAAGLTLPFVPGIRGMFTVLSTYVQNWEFSGFAFRALRGMTSSGDSARLVLGFVFLFTAAVLYGRLLLGNQSSIEQGTRGRSYDTHPNDWPGPPDKDGFLKVIKVFYALTMAFLFLTPTFHPWYALYLACLLPFTGGAAGLVLSWSVFFSYRVLIPYEILGRWIEDDYTSALIWFAPACAYLLVLVARRLKHRQRAGYSGSLG